MRRLAAIVALATLGCDDPAVASKALDVLEFGAVQAKITCVNLGGHVMGTPQCGAGNGRTLVWQRIADGSAFTNTPIGLNWFARSEPEAQTMSFYEPDYQDTWSIAGGEIVVEKDGCSDIVFDISTYCTGFNLEAFE